jgi:dihydrolipoamide dehydrogenase
VAARQAEGGKGGGPQEIAADRVLLAAGFLPNSQNLGLEELGVTVNRRGFIEIDERMRTSVPGIYAVGDITGKVALAHVAFAQGHVAAEVIAGHETIELDYNAMPRCTYTSPQVAAIGLTEEQAKEQYGEIKVGKYPIQPNGKAQALGERDGVAKIIGDARTGEILGAHLIGPEVTEMIAEFSLAKFLESTAEEIARSVHPHPTISEVIGEAALAVEGSAIHI